MSDGNPQSALREWRRQMTRPVTLIVVAGVGAVLGLTGPFGTQDLLRLVPRVLYWLVMVGATYGTGALIHDLLAPHLTRVALPWRIVAGGTATALGVAAVVLMLNLGTFGYWPGADEMVPFLGTILSISLIVTATLSVLSRQLAPGGAQTMPDHPPRPALLDRLPLDKRGGLVALSVEDHYVLIRTTKGQELILMRLSDAIRETAPSPGAQVHRSHWVAFDQVRAARRDGDRAILTMSTGPEIPVSRANLPKIKEAGLLPR